MSTVTVLKMIKMALGMFLLFPSLVFSVEHYVDGENGNDTNDGSDAAPWKTIGYALNQSWPEAETNTLFIQPVEDGYNELISLSSPVLHSLNITGLRQGGEMPLIDASDVTLNHAIILTDYSGTIQGLEVTGAESNGIDIAGASLEAKVINCRIHGNTKGIHVNGTSTPLLLNNVIYDNSACGIGNMGDSSATISGNQIYENGSGIFSGTSAGICVPQNASPKIYNNIIRNNYPSGINILDTATPVISNNIIAGHHLDGDFPITGSGVKVIHGNSCADVVPINNVAISNNIIIDNDYALFSQCNVPVSGNSFNSFWENTSNYFGFTTGSNEINTDPLLESDYRVAEGSPCIDSGTSINAPTADKNGVSRPVGAGFDMGIYEYQERDRGATCLHSILFLLLSKEKNSNN